MKNLDSNNPKILIFMDWYKPGYKAGGPIQSISNTISLIKNDYKIYIVTRNTDYNDTEEYSSIKTNAWNKINEYENVFYCSKSNLSRRTLKEIIEKIAPSIIYCNSLYSIYFTLYPLLVAKSKKINSVLAVRGMLSEGSLSVKKRKKIIFISILNRLNILNQCRLQATSDDEKNQIKKYLGDKIDIRLVENPPAFDNLMEKYHQREKGVLRIIYVGRISPEKNLKYALEILKCLEKEIEFTIIGPINDAFYWNECKKIIKTISNKVKVQYLGAVPNPKVRVEFLRNDILLFPTTGENFGHVIYESMSYGCIPVISDKTPWRGLERLGVGYDVAIDGKKKFVECLQNLFDLEVNQMNKIKERGIEYAKNYIQSSSLKEDYNELFLF